MNYAYCDTPIGTLTMLQQDDALVALQIGQTPPAADWLAGETPLFSRLRRQLGEYFAGKRQAFDLPLAPQGTAFQRVVWAQLTQIPYGETIAYGALAAAVGKPNAARAVGGACNKNPLLILVPCHRVLGANGKLVGFAAGVSNKKFLLQLEADTLQHAPH